MNNSVFFSIIIPTYNRADLIEKTISSVLDQSFTDFEILVIDDGSTDNTEEVVKNIVDYRLSYYKKINQERAVARNYGIKLAKGKYITFLDSDDILYQNHFKEAIKLISQYTNSEFFHIRYEIKDISSLVSKAMPYLCGDINKKLIEGNFLSCQGVFLRNDICKLNLFNENRLLSTLEDWELWLRMATKYKIYYSNTITSAIINHSNRSVLDMDIEKLIEKFDIFMETILLNSAILNYYQSKINKFKSSCYTYIALHISLTKKNRITTLKYIIKGIIENPKTIFSRRFAAILKHII